ncbi:MAG: LEVG family PEP-CTERM protein [Coleofasciculus sp. C1-SOL-03]|jgi:hypothetical protein|uniref:LEVG family PEP-CTERM protein n=1 Tax=Coleofasciculus sp. C1-SOL-03 TaxID=3069522 RepID=UPI0032F5A195
MKSLSTLFRHSATVASLIAASTVTAGLIAPSASAMSLVPQEEGQVQLTNSGSVGCAQGTCISTDSFGYSITSLEYDENSNLSPLFVDKGATEDTYSFNSFTIEFPERDPGTNSEITEEFWFRPVAINSNGKPRNEGRLEIGRFLFEFDEEVEEMTLDLSFFDVEDGNVSGIIEVNGEDFEPLLPGGPDDAIQSVTLNNVESFVVQLGNPNSTTFPSSGDGVLLQVEKSVPEPGTVLGLGTLAMAGGLGLRKRNKKSDA